MDSVFIEYRDPLFSLISIFIIVFIISIISFLSSVAKQNKNKKLFDNMLSRLSFSSSNTPKQTNNYIKHYKNGLISYENMLDICVSLEYQKKSNEAIYLYLQALKYTNKKSNQLELMDKLAYIYFNCGFLQRSHDMYLEIIRLEAKNTKALKQLFIVCLKLNDFSKSRDIIQSLKELKLDTYGERVLYKISKNISSNKTLDNKTKKLLEICASDKVATRMVAEFLLQNNQQAFWDNLDIFDLEQCIDILWFLQIDDKNKQHINNNLFLKYVFYHKQDISKNENNKELKQNEQTDVNADANKNAKQNNRYKTYLEIDILNQLKKQKSNIKADVSFSFFCNSCKKTHYCSNFVCNYCSSVFKSSIKTTMIKQQEKSIY